MLDRGEIDQERVMGEARAAIRELGRKNVRREPARWPEVLERAVDWVLRRKPTASEQAQGTVKRYPIRQVIVDAETNVFGYETFIETESGRVVVATVPDWNCIYVASVRG